MSTGRLAANIAVRNPRTGEVETFTAGSTVPSWAAERITNPDAWASDGPDVGAVPAPTPDSDTDPEGVPDRPPLAGKGSSRASWAAYARSLGIQIDDDMGRDDIVDAVDDELASRDTED